MKTRILLVVGALLAISGCAAQQPVTPAVVGGSRADGVVRVSYDGGVNTPVNWAQADQQARESCAQWGYTGAKKFGGELRVCLQEAGIWGCVLHRITVEYQCLD